MGQASREKQERQQTASEIVRDANRRAANPGPEEMVGALRSVVESAVTIAMEQAVLPKINEIQDVVNKLSKGVMETLEHYADGINRSQSVGMANLRVLIEKGMVDYEQAFVLVMLASAISEKTRDLPPKVAQKALRNFLEGALEEEITATLDEFRANLKEEPEVTDGED